MAHLRNAAHEAMSLVQLRLHSGRLHQIRAHLSHVGHAILGDKAYGGPGGHRVMLHALRLQMELPKLTSCLDVTAPLPPEFQELLDVLEPCHRPQPVDL